jgi:hypothetical protein
MDDTPSLRSLMEMAGGPAVGGLTVWVLEWVLKKLEKPPRAPVSSMVGGGGHSLDEEAVLRVIASMRRLRATDVSESTANISTLSMGDKVRHISLGNGMIQGVLNPSEGTVLVLFEGRNKPYPMNVSYINKV